MRNNKETINKMKEMRSNGVSTYEIATELGVSQSNVMYWVNEEVKKKQSARAVKNFKDKSPEEKREIYRSRKEYFAAWFKKKYDNDEEFRKKHIERVKRQKKKKKK